MGILWKNNLAYCFFYLHSWEDLVIIPCAKRLVPIVTGLSFLRPALTTIQFDNLTLITTALIVGGTFSISAIHRMWLKEKAISTISHFLSDAKFYTPEMEILYAKRVLQAYQISEGFFIIDDTMQHHSMFCKWIHGVFVLFDHALKTNLKAICIVFLYYSDGVLVKFPITFRIYYKSTGKTMPWQRGRTFACKTKYELAIAMLEWALQMGFPKAVVLADSWYGIEPFIEGLKRINLSYVLEIKCSLKIKTACKEPKRTPKGKLAKNQFELTELPNFFKSVRTVSKCGLAHDLETGQEDKILYHLKVATLQLNAFTGKHRIAESVDPVKGTRKYLISDQLNWDPIKMVSAYSQRWVIEEFFRNAKQLADMEGVSIRSEQGVTLALCLVSWIDFLLHFENYEQSTAGELSKESLTIPSIVRQWQFENFKALIQRVQDDETFVEKWIQVQSQQMYRKRKKRKPLILLDQNNEEPIAKAA